MVNRQDAKVAKSRLRKPPVPTLVGSIRHTCLIQLLENNGMSFGVISKSITSGSPQILASFESWRFKNRLIVIDSRRANCSYPCGLRRPEPLCRNPRLEGPAGRFAVGWTRHRSVKNASLCKNCKLRPGRPPAHDAPLRIWRIAFAGRCRWFSANLPASTRPRETCVSLLRRGRFAPRRMP